MIDSNSSETQTAKAFSMRVITPGMIALAICVLLSLSIGYYTAYNTKGDATLIAAMSIFIFPSPYLLFALVGFAIVVNRRSRTLGMAFNVGAAILLIAWWVGNFYIDVPGDTLAQRLNTSLVYTVIGSGVLVAVQIGLLFVVNMLVWTDE